MSTNKTYRNLLGFAAAMALVVALPNTAAAQWGMGMGWGMFGVPESPSTRFLNDHAHSRAGAVAAGRSRSHSANAGSSNSYLNRVRDNGFTPHYDARRRRAPSYQPERTGSLANSGREESRPAAATARPLVPLKDFFDSSLRLVWPQESPVDGEFGEKRDIAGQASLAVLKQKKEYGSAPITSVTDARQKLVAYGQPALRHLRTAATPPIADAFHRFLLSLYDALEAAASQSANPTAPVR